MKNIALIISYDGSKFFGWQKQAGVMTVQQVIEEAIKKVSGEKVNLTGASRTDRGVHALCQVANFFTSANIPPESWHFALAPHLPNSIVIKASKEVSHLFNARFCAKAKTYMYIVDNSPYKNVFLANRVFYFPYKLDYTTMLVAKDIFIGEKDFKSLANNYPPKAIIARDEQTNTIRTIYDIRIEKKADFFIFYVKGNGFLYRMVRNLVGTLLDAGRGKKTVEQIKEGLYKKDRKLMGFCAPPHALYLYYIDY